MTWIGKWFLLGRWVMMENDVVVREVCFGEVSEEEMLGAIE
jgi:hypothetical protein